MKKKNMALLLTGALACSVLFSSCLGSFTLSRRMLEWNNSIDNKYINEAVFIAFNVVLVYPLVFIADLIVLNSIEFWSGANPASTDIGTTQTIDTKDGIYTVETQAGGYHIQKAGEAESIDLTFEASDKSWSVESGGESSKLFRFEGEDKVVMYLPDGKEMPVELSQAGIYAFRQTANRLYMANR